MKLGAPTRDIGMRGDPAVQPHEMPLIRRLSGLRTI
jgi:hypothetical protein